MVYLYFEAQFQLHRGSKTNHSEHWQIMLGNYFTEFQSDFDE